MELAHVRESIGERTLNEFQIHPFLYAGACSEVCIHVTEQRVEPSNVLLPVQPLMTDAVCPGHYRERERHDVGHMENELACRHTAVGQPDGFKARGRIAQ